MRLSFATSSLLALLFVLTCAFTSAFAATPAAGTQPEIRLQAWRVQTVVAKGEVTEQLEPLKDIRPGDVVQYEALYVNGTSKSVKDVLLTLPVPEGGMQYLPAAITGTPVHSASLDGKRFEPVPLRRDVRLPDGSRRTIEVPVSEYRYLRWNLGDLPAGAQRAVRARMQLPALTGASRS